MKKNATKLMLLPLAGVIMLALVSCKKETNAAAMTTSGSTDASILKGKWLRPDGGYVIDIRSIDSASGKIEAAYFNPNPIKVAAAQLRQESGALNLFIELRDAGYPGCTYKLTYDHQSDQLKGVYYQAAVQESYDIFFVRFGEEK
jgi:hypothetical protein